MKRLYIFTLGWLIAAVGIFCFKERKPTTISAAQGAIVPREWLVVNEHARTPKADVRPADQTLLTFPEWFLVFSPDEQANYFKKHTATTCPFMTHTAQIWESYKIVSDQVRGRFPVNTGYHFMIWVIGSSATAEYAVKAWYETLIGRITDTQVPLTEEDKFNADFTQSYVDFIRDRPWYEYNFRHKLGVLWSDISLTGPCLARKAERRYILTSELLVKYVYGKLIGIGTKQVYVEALPTTAVILEDDSLHYFPRYDRFAKEALGSVRSGHAFKEIAGNNSAILVTVLARSNEAVKFENTITLFTQPMPSDTTTNRVALVTPVTKLHQLLLALDKRKIKIEHIFDY